MATRREDTRPMNYAISKLFKNAYATFRENMYKVETIEPGKPIDIDWETYNRMKQRLRLLDLKTFDGLALPSFNKPKTDGELAKYYREFYSKVRINEITKVIANLTPELEIFICDNCHKFFKGINYIKGISRFVFDCDNCGGILSQAP